MMTWPQWENPECWNELIMKKAFEAVDSERTAKSIGFNWIYMGEITSKQAVMSVNFKVVLSLIQSFILFKLLLVSTVFY